MISFSMKFTISLLAVLLFVVTAHATLKGIVVSDGVTYALKTSDAEGGDRLEVIDTSWRGRFKKIAELLLSDAPVDSPKQFADALYLPLTNRIHVVDIFTPTKPDYLCRLEPPFPGNITNCTVTHWNATLHVSGDKGSCVYDLEDPYSPILKSITLATNLVEESFPLRFHSPPLSFSKYFPQDSYTNLYFYTKGLQAGICLKGGRHSETNLETFFTAKTLVGVPQSVAFDERGFVVLACRADGIRVFRIGTNEVNKVSEVTTIKTGGDARDVLLHEGIIHVADGVKGLATFALDEYGLLTRLPGCTILHGNAVALRKTTDELFVFTDEETVFSRPLTNTTERILLRKEVCSGRENFSDRE